MRWFSERNGYKKVQDKISKENIDEILSVQIWNIMQPMIFQRKINYFQNTMKAFGWSKDNLFRKYENFFIQLWTNFFKLPVDSIGDLSNLDELEKVYKLIRGVYIESSKTKNNTPWYIKLDLIEFILHYSILPEAEIELFKVSINECFQNNLSIYRIIGKTISPINSQQEVEAISFAMKKSRKFKNVSVHLDTALTHLSARKNPDFRNSTKESISAVEAMCQLIVGNPNASLGQALKEITKSKKIEIAEPLKIAYEKIFGYSSSTGGIRHALSDSSKINFEDALFMLSTCSAFISYLIEKSIKAGIKL